MAMRYPGRGQQRGAVALIVGLLSVLVLFGMMGIAVDLAYLYARKTELQNAADAAALSGAKELNQTPGGVAAAVNAAIATFGANATANLVDGETISINNIRLGPCPNPDDRLPLRTPSCTFVDASSVDSGEEAAPLSFLEVDTGVASTKPVFFMPVIGGQDNASAQGYAVAGYYLTQITPIGVCAVEPFPGGVGNPGTRTSKYTYADGTTELLELGFRRGVSYNIIALNPMGSPGVPMLLNPVDMPPAFCDPSHSSADTTAPFVCQGNSAVKTSSGAATRVYVNTGYSAGKIEKALNSRFDNFGGGNSSPCDPATSPPDSNVMQYDSDKLNNKWWNSPPPPQKFRQSVAINNNLPSYVSNFPISGSLPARPFLEYGVLWSYSRAYQADGSSPPKAGSVFAATNENWNKLYNNNVPPATPGDLLNTPNAGTAFPGTSTPYYQSAYEVPPPKNPPGKAGRRVLNIVIVDCQPLSGNLACASADVRGIGKFFLQVEADLTSGNKRIETEFAGLIDPVASAEIKLYR